MANPSVNQHTSDPSGGKPPAGGARSLAGRLLRPGAWPALGRDISRKLAERRFAAKVWPEEAELARERETVFSSPLLISVATPLYNTDPDLLREMIDSVCAQTYGSWELCLADGSDEAHALVGEYCRKRAAEEPRIRYLKLERNEGISENSNACLRMAAGAYIALLDHDDLLTPNALYEIRRAVEATGADFLYSDEMVFQGMRRDRVTAVRLKPGFSPDSLLANNYICHLTVFSRDLLRRAGGFRKAYDGSQDHDLFLRMTDQARGIAHVSKVLYLWRSVSTSVASDVHRKDYAISAGRNAVRDFLRERKATDAEVESSEVFPTMFRVRYPVEGTPGVRVIIDARREPGPFAQKLQTLQAGAGWERCAWTVIAGAPGRPAAPGQNREDAQNPESLPEGWKLLVPEAGESRRSLWNRAAKESEEEYLLFADGIPQPMTDGWIRELLGIAQRDHVGAVGPKITFAQAPGRIRHAGVVTGMGPEGLAGRPYYRSEPENTGYFGRIAVTGNVSALADCLMVSREKWLRAGGFAEAYADALFEVDLCLRLLEEGYYQVYHPEVWMEMGREEDARFEVGREYASWPRDAEAFRSRNAARLRNGDPCYHPALSLKRGDWRVR